MTDSNISFENKDYYIELGLNIAFYRKRAGMTQDMLAEKADLSRSHLSAIEAPNIIRPFSLEILFNISRALGVEPYKLLQFRDQKLHRGHGIYLWGKERPKKCPSMISFSAPPGEPKRLQFRPQTPSAGRAPISA